MLSGYATIRVLERQVQLRRGVSVIKALFNLDAQIARLAAERERLRRELLRLVDAHLDDGTPRVIDRALHESAT